MSGSRSLRVLVDDRYYCRLVIQRPLLTDHYKFEVSRTAVRG